MEGEGGRGRGGEGGGIEIVGMEDESGEGGGIEIVGGDGNNEGVGPVEVGIFLGGGGWEEGGLHNLSIFIICFLVT